MTYWQERQQQLNDQLEKDEEKLKLKLSKSYDIQQKKLEKEIAGYYQAYGENNVIEYRKLMESLSYEDKQLLLQRMDEFAEKYPQYAHLMPVRESIYKLNRLEGLQTSIKMQQLEIGAIDNAELQNHFEQLALRSANSSAEQLGFGKNFYTVSSDLIAKTVNKQWADGKNFSERIWDNRSKLAGYLNNDFAMAIARGDSYEKCIKALGERFSKVLRNDIYRLIYTEGTFVQNEASITPFEDDFEEYQISIADERACNRCKAMRDKKFNIKDRQAGVNFPPFHSWCRCSFTIAVDNWDKWMDDYVERHTSESGISNKKSTATSENSVDLEYINSKEYHDKFKGITENPKVDERIYSLAKGFLTHRNGSNKEDLALVHSETGKIVGHQYSSKSEYGVDYNKSLDRAISENSPYSLISIHNHPTNNPPTGSDFVSAGGKKYKMGVVVTHDGKVFTYKAGNKPFMASTFGNYVDKYRGMPYNLSEYNAIIKTLEDFKQIYGIEWSELE